MEYRIHKYFCPDISFRENVPLLFQYYEIQCFDPLFQCYSSQTLKRMINSPTNVITILCKMQMILIFNHYIIVLHTYVLITSNIHLSNYTSCFCILKCKKRRIVIIFLFCFTKKQNLPFQRVKIKKLFQKSVTIQTNWK